MGAELPMLILLLTMFIVLAYMRRERDEGDGDDDDETDGFFLPGFYDFRRRQHDDAAYRGY